MLLVICLLQIQKIRKFSPTEVICRIILLLSFMGLKIRSKENESNFYFHNWKQIEKMNEPFITKHRKPLY